MITTGTERTAEMKTAEEVRAAMQAEDISSDMVIESAWMHYDSALPLLGRVEQATRRNDARGAALARNACDAWIEAHVTEAAETVGKMVAKRAARRAQTPSQAVARALRGED